MGLYKIVLKAPEEPLGFGTLRVGACALETLGTGAGVDMLPLSVTGPADLNCSNFCATWACTVSS
jgi:hypothetical protein